jgi:hypothetical protein
MSNYKKNVAGILLVALVCLIHHSNAQTNPVQRKLIQFNLLIQTFSFPIPNIPATATPYSGNPRKFQGRHVCTSRPSQLDQSACIMDMPN